MDHKLKIFIKVAELNSFTDAAQALNLSQPAVSKTIAKLEEKYNTTFFHRNYNSINISNNGKLFLDFSYRIIELYEEMHSTFLTEEEMSELNFKIGLSTTLSSYIIPKIIAKIRYKEPHITFQITSGNTKTIEDKIINQVLDYGITEGKSSNPLLSYSQFLKDEIVLVTNSKNHKAPNEVSLETLNELPIVYREPGSGTREIIEQNLKLHSCFSLNTILTLTSTEAIVQYLLNSDEYGFLSIHSISQKLVEDKLKIIDIKDFSIERMFYFVHRTGYQSQKMSYIFKLISTNHNL